MNEEQALVLDATFTLGAQQQKSQRAVHCASICEQVKKLLDTRMLKRYLSVRQQVVELKRAERLFDDTDLPRFTLCGRGASGLGSVGNHAMNNLTTTSARCAATAANASRCDWLASAEL